MLSLVAVINCQDPAPPDATQAQCIAAALDSQGNDIVNDCGNIDIDNVSQLSAICNTGACFTRISRILDSCNYNGLRVGEYLQIN